MGKEEFGGIPLFVKVLQLLNDNHVYMRVSNQLWGSKGKMYYIVPIAKQMEKRREQVAIK